MLFEAMIWIDFVILASLLIAIGNGFFKCARQEVYAIFCWLIAYGVSLNFSLEFEVFLQSVVKVPSISLAACFVTLAFITLMVGKLIGLLSGELIKKPELTALDRFGGMTMGIVHGVFVMVFVVLLAGLTPLPEELWWNESKLISPLQLISVWFRDTISSEMIDYIHYR